MPIPSTIQRSDKRAQEIWQKTHDSAIETYLWELDDDALVAGAQTNHTYDEPGTYYITLTVIDGNEEMGFSAPVEVVVE
jgi:PKD repeat protein